MKFLNRFENSSFHFLNITQFLGALNDNTFKYLVIFLLIHVKGAALTSKIVATAGAVFVIPFLVFISAAGILADKLSKRNIVVSMKGAELIVMALSIIAFYFQSEWGAYILLFLMTTQSAIFSPSKYGIIPEIVETKKISKANGILTASTYLAIILGTFLASFITDITSQNFVIAALACVLIAILGLISSFKIEKTIAKKGKKKIHPVFFYDIYKTLVLTAKRPYLFWSIFGSAFFLFSAAFAQLNIISFAIQSLHLKESAGGYLFLPIAIGICIGSLIGGRMVKEKIELGLSCLASYLLALTYLLLWIFSKYLYFDIIILGLLGISAGMFLIPFDTFIQVRSPDQKRGQVIAAANFLSFFGVLLSAIFIFVVNEILGFSAASGFGLMGILMLIFAILISGRLADTFLPFIARSIFRKIFSIHVNNPSESQALFLCNKRPWFQALVLYAIVPDLRFITSKKSFFSFPYFNGFCSTIHLVNDSISPSNLRKFIERKKSRVLSMCIYMDRSFNKNEIQSFSKVYENVINLHIEKTKIRKRSFLGFWYNQTQFIYSFNPAVEKIES